MTLSSTSFRIMTLSIKGIFETLIINDTQRIRHLVYKTLSITKLLMLSAIMLSVAFYLLLC